MKVIVLAGGGGTRLFPYGDYLEEDDIVRFEDIYGRS